GRTQEHLCRVRRRLLRDRQLGREGHRLTSLDHPPSPLRATPGAVGVTARARRLARISVLPRMILAPARTQPSGTSPKTTAPQMAAKTTWRYPIAVARPAGSSCRPRVR